MLYTDFGSADIYLGQVKSVLHRIAPRAGVIDLANDLPPFNVRAAAHLLDALKNAFAEGSSCAWSIPAWAPRAGR